MAFVTQIPREKNHNLKINVSRIINILMIISQVIIDIHSIASEVLLFSFEK